ncbi:uncharacterized protein [Dendropsophus ebraccatus]|uniref:uncharacterized protein n=1 Tax=Dendropsophus ebraccatus TaxID=150705 RepID=UPI00383231F1
MSPVAPDTGGFVVISQVRPENDQGDRPEGESSDAPVTLPKPLVSFYQGEPEALGTVQIFAGILLISIGVHMTILQSQGYRTIMTIIGVMFWSGILYIITGSLSVSASVKPTIRKVKASLGMNIFNVLVSSCGILLSFVDIGVFSPPLGDKALCAHYNGDVQCLGAFYVSPVVRGYASFTVMLFVLMFCIAVSTSVFASRTVCRASFHEMQVVIYQTTTLNVSDPSRDLPPDPAAALTCPIPSCLSEHGECRISIWMFPLRVAHLQNMIPGDLGKQQLGLAPPLGEASQTLTEETVIIMSTNANAGNVVILQHVSPQNSQRMESLQGQSKHPPHVPKHLVKFFRGEPEVLGVVQLFIGINHILFGVVFTITIDPIQFSSMRVLVKTSVIYWSGILYIISGSMSVAACYKPSLAKVKASLTLHVIINIAALVSLVILAAFLFSISVHYYYHHENDYCAYYKESETCEGEFAPATVFEGIGATLLLFTTLEFCIALSTSIFGCKTVCRTSYNEVAVVIYQTTNDPKPALSSDGAVTTP